MKAGLGFLAIWSDVAPEQETDYLHWLTREHTQERVSIPGFLGVRVFRSRAAGVRRYFILYTLTQSGVMGSEAYVERLNAPTPWSQRIMPILGNFRRGGGTVTARLGSGFGALVAPVLLEGDEAAQAPARATALAGRDRIIAVSLLAVDGAGTGIQTNEKTLRTGDRSFDTLMLAEAVDAEALTAALGGTELFDQIFALDKAQLVP
jgi:hypothetical protein